MDLTNRLHFSVTPQANKLHFGVTQKGVSMPNPRLYRSLDEWFNLVQEARKSGMTDAQWCLSNGISRHTFNNAIRRLRKKSFAIPKPKQDIHDFTVKVDIVPDGYSPAVKPHAGFSIDKSPEPAPYIDNSHMIEISFGDVHISLSNGADPVLVSKTLSLLRSYA